MKAAEQYRLVALFISAHSPMVLSIMLYKVVLSFESVDEILSVTIQMKATEQYSSVLLSVFQ